jgi:hypothetical protein
MLKRNLKKEDAMVDGVGMKFSQLALIVTATIVMQLKKTGGNYG